MNSIAKAEERILSDYKLPDYHQICFCFNCHPQLSSASANFRPNKSPEAKTSTVVPSALISILEVISPTTTVFLRLINGGIPTPCDPN